MKWMDEINGPLLTHIQRKLPVHIKESSAKEYIGYRIESGSQKIRLNYYGNSKLEPCLIDFLYMHQYAMSIVPVCYVNSTSMICQ